MLGISYKYSTAIYCRKSIDTPVIMGKAQKMKVSKKNQVTSVAPLGDQLHSSEVAAPTGRVKERNRLDEDEDYVESRLSKNIITQARLQVINQSIGSINQSLHLFITF